MARIKMLNLSVDRPLSELGESLILAEESYNVESCSDQLLEATYIEKIYVRETVMDSNGIESEVDIIRYRRYKFKIVNKVYEGCLLFVESPPRTLRPLMDSLSELVKGKFFVSDVNIDINAFIEACESSKDLSIEKIDKVRSSHVQVNRTSYCDIMVTSSHNAVDVLAEIFNNKNVKINKARFVIDTKFGSTSIELSSSGIVNVSEDYMSDILEFIVDGLGIKYSFLIM